MEKVTRLDLKVTVRNWDNMEEKDLYYTNSLPKWEDVWKGPMSPIKIVLTSQDGTTLTIDDSIDFSVGSFDSQYEYIEFATMLKYHGKQDKRKYEDKEQFGFASYFLRKQLSVDSQNTMDLIHRIHRSKI